MKPPGNAFQYSSARVKGRNWLTPTCSTALRGGRDEPVILSAFTGSLELRGPIFSSRGRGTPVRFRFQKITGVCLRSLDAGIARREKTISSGCEFNAWPARASGNRMIRKLLTLVFVASTAVSCGWGAEAPKTGTVQFPVGTTSEMVSGFVAEPTTTVRHPAVIVIHTWLGLNDWIKEQTQKLADQGFVALAVDLYDGHVANDTSSAQELKTGLKDGIAIRDLMAAYAYLYSRKDIDRDHIGAIGWDMGGAYALKLAMYQPHLAACVVNYGTLPTDPTDIQQIVAPVLGNFGALEGRLTE